MAAMSSQFAGNDTVLQRSDIALYRGEQQLGAGQLIVGESCLQWESNDKSYSVSLEYPDIPIHGISSDTSSFPHKCVYLLHSVVRERERGEEFDDEARDEDGDEELVELRLVPTDASQLESIYSAISECQLLYPDPEDSDSEEEEEAEEMVEEESGVYVSEGGDGFFTSEEGLQQLTDEGRAALQHLESVFQVTSTSQFTDMMEGHDNGHNNDQFEDAD